MNLSKHVKDEKISSGFYIVEVNKASLTLLGKTATENNFQGYQQYPFSNLF